VHNKKGHSVQVKKKPRVGIRIIILGALVYMVANTPLHHVIADYCCSCNIYNNLFNYVLNVYNCRFIVRDM
jgi:hypothetical protein